MADKILGYVSALVVKATAPVNQNALWRDTSVIPSILRFWDGAQWAELIVATGASLVTTNTPQNITAKKTSTAGIVFDADNVPSGQIKLQNVNDSFLIWNEDGEFRLSSTIGAADAIAEELFSATRTSLTSRRPHTFSSTTFFTGQATFSGVIAVPTPTANTHAANKTYVDTLLQSYPAVGDDRVITGEWEFNIAPTIGAATLGGQAINRDLADGRYVRLINGAANQAIQSIITIGTPTNQGDIVLDIENSANIDGNLTVPFGGISTLRSSIGGQVLPTGNVVLNVDRSAAANQAEVVLQVGQSANIDGNLNVTGSTTNNSDKRLKENILPWEGNWNSLLAFNSKTFNKIGWDNSEIGVIAQDIQSMWPEVVYENEETGFLGVDYSRFGVIALSYIKQLKEEVDNLKSQLSK